MTAFPFATGAAGPFLSWLWRGSWQAAVVVGVVMVVRAVAFRGAATRWRVALWSLVLVRLLLPVTVTSKFSLFNVRHWVDVARARVAFHTTAPIRSAGGEPPTGGPSGALIERHGVASDEPSPLPVTSDLRRFTSMPRSDAVLLMIWVAGASLVASKFTLAQREFTARLRGATPVADGALIDLLNTAARQMGMRRVPALLLTDAVDSPAVTGLLRRRILLPPALVGSLTPRQLRLIFLHELAHLRRGDLWWDVLCTATLALHWFNPALWLALARYRADRELARDAMVLRAAGASEAEGYGRTILLLIERMAAGPRRLHLAGILGLVNDDRGLRGRIHGIAQCGRPRAMRAIVAASALALVGCATLTDRERGTTRPRIAEVADSPSRSRGVRTLRPPEPEPAENPRDAAARAKLDRPLPPVNFQDKPFGEVVDALRELGGVDVHVDWPELQEAGVDEQWRIRFRSGGGESLGAVLTGITTTQFNRARFRHAVKDGVIVITTAERADQLELTTRAYDVTDLVAVVPDYDAVPELGKAARSPDVGLGGGQGALNGIMNGGGVSGHGQTQRERVDALIKLLEETVRPITWRDNGGQLSSIKELSAQLIVTAPLDDHRAILAIINQLREARAYQVSLETRFVCVDPNSAHMEGELKSVLDMGNEATFLSPARLDALLKAVTSHPDAAASVAPRMTLFNGQHAWSLVATQRSYVSDLTPVVGNGVVGYQPTVEVVESGVLLDARATVSADRKYVTVSLRPQVCRLERLEDVPFDKPADGHAPVIQRPVLSLSELRTTVSIPDGQAVILGGFTTSSGPAARAAERDLAAKVGAPPAAAAPPSTQPVGEAIFDRFPPNSRIFLIVKAKVIYQPPR